MSALSSPTNAEQLAFVLENLRAPEFKYTGPSTALAQKTLASLRLANADKVSSLMSLAAELQQQHGVPDVLVNLMFVAERCFDVWLRKAEFDQEINAYVSQLRLHFVLLGAEQGLAGIELLGLVIDDLAGMLNIWCAHPERARKQAQALLDKLACTLCSEPNKEGLSKARDLLASYQQEQRQKADKLCTRLVSQEQRHARQNYIQAHAQTLINKVFNKAQLPPTAHRFVREALPKVLQTELESSAVGELPEPIKLLLNRLYVVFVEQGAQGFKHSDNLIEQLEDLSDQSASLRLQIKPLFDEILAILKLKDLPSEPFAGLDDAPDLSEFSSSNALAPKLGERFVLPGQGRREQVAAVYDDYGQILMVNYLGMKTGLYSLQGFRARIASRELLALGLAPRFNEVFSQSLKGLYKVASNQQQSRQQAAQKAREEAQALLIAQQEAAQQAQAMAAQADAEARDQARSAQLKTEQERRLSMARGLVCALAIGAWISVDLNGQRTRFKLVVKLSASKRYLFVDKYGIKKLEYDEEALVDAVANEELELLSDGADFDDSLERVIGRMRLSQ